MSRNHSVFATIFCGIRVLYIAQKDDAIGFNDKGFLNMAHQADSCSSPHQR